MRLIATFRKERHQIMASCTQSRLVFTCQPDSVNYRTSFCPFFCVPALDTSGLEATVWPKKKLVGSCALSEGTPAAIGRVSRNSTASPRCDTLSNRCVLLRSSRCASESRLPQHLWHCFCLYGMPRARTKWQPRSQRRASNGSSRSRGRES